MQVALATTRDNWDWAILVLTSLASVVALLLFAPWALERRRRPEVRIVWQILGDHGVPRREWHMDDVLTLEGGEPLSVRAALLNVGDAVSQGLLNLVVPVSLKLGHETLDTKTSTNRWSGEPPHRAVGYLAAGLTVAPGDWYVVDVTLEWDQEGPERELRVLLDVTDPRFNTTGRRWFPSLALRTTGDAPDTGEVETWPRPPSCRVVRRVKAEGASFHAPCQRMDARHIRVRPQVEPDGQ